MSNFPVPPAVPEAPKPVSGFYLFARVFDEPTMVFQELARRPRLGVPILMLFLTLIVQQFAIPKSVLLAQTNKGLDAAEQFTGRPLTPEVRAQSLQNVGSLQSRAIGSVTGSAGFVVITCIIALVYWGLFSMAGSDVSFKEELSILLYANAPVLLGLIVVAGLSPVTQSASFNIGLGFLVSYDSSPFLHTLLTFVTVFSVWQLYLVALGNQVKRKAKTIGGSLTLVVVTFLVCSLPLAFIFSKFGNFTG